MSSEIQPAKLTSLEHEMLGKGYASARMLAWKLKVHFTSLLRNLRLGKLAGVKVGNMNFISIDSVRAFYGDPYSQMRRLDDWSDVLQHFDGGGDARSSG